MDEPEAPNEQTSPVPYEPAQPPVIERPEQAIPQQPIPEHLVGVLGCLGRGRAIAGIWTSPLAQIELSVV